MVKDARSLRRNNKGVPVGHHFAMTQPGGTYEARNVGTLHRPHWVFEDDRGTTVPLKTKEYIEFFRPVYVDSPQPEKPEVGDTDVEHDHKAPWNQFNGPDYPAGQWD
ncbi:MAG: hypothetical protein V3S69_03210 [Dehalococcoidales bacterium]